MNRKMMAGVALAALGLAGSARAQAQQQMDKQMQQPTGKEASHLRTVTVTVRDVDPKNHNVTFQAHVSPEANFKSGQGQPIRIDDLKQGDQVRAAFDPKTGEVMSVQVLRVGGKKSTTGTTGSTGGGSSGSSTTPSK